MMKCICTHWWKGSRISDELQEFSLFWNRFSSLSRASVGHLWLLEKRFNRVGRTVTLNDSANRLTSLSRRQETSTLPTGMTNPPSHLTLFGKLWQVHFYEIIEGLWSSVIFLQLTAGPESLRRRPSMVAGLWYSWVCWKKTQSYEMWFHCTLDPSSARWISIDMFEWRWHLPFIACVCCSVVLCVSSFVCFLQLLSQPSSEVWQKRESPEFVRRRWLSDCTQLGSGWRPRHPLRRR